MKKRGTRKWNVRAIAILMTMIFAVNIPGLKTQAKEVKQSSDSTNYDVGTTDKIVAYSSAVQPLTTMFNCEIILAFTLEGLEMTFTTSSVKDSSVIGVKDIKVQQKMWYGWKTVMTSDGAENQNASLFIAGLTYPDAVNGKTYRVICTHYANYDVYEETVNDTGAFKFVI